MPEEKVDWRVKVADIAEEIYKEASNLKEFLSMFFDFPAARLPEVRPVASLVEVVVERLSRIVDIAVTILQEVSKEKVDWERIKEVFPTRAWLGSIEASLHHLDLNPKFRGIMPFYSGRLREDFTENIEAKFQQILDIFVRELGLEEIGEKYTEELKSEPPTEEELEREYEEATGKRTPRLEDLPSLFDKISEILTQELEEKQGFSTYWEDITEQFESALRAGDIDELRDIYRQVKVLFESLPEAKRETYANIFNQFFTAVRDYTLPLLKFKLIRRLLGLE
jgi:molybdopterin-guanine dinucleotide biosynthesis protein A